MKGIKRIVSRHKKTIVIALALFVVGACLRWEVREVADAQTGKVITRSSGVVAPWQPCGASGAGTPINFHVRHWLCYGLVKLEATGQTM